MQNRYRYHRQSLKPKKDLKPLLSIAKRSRKYHWLSQFDSTSLQQAIINLDKAFDRFLKHRGGYPRFKNKHSRQSSYHCSGSIGYGKNWIKVGKLKTQIKAKIHRQIKGKIRSITISRDTTGKHYASLILADTPRPQEPLKQVSADKVIGLDVGLTHMLTDSKGNKQDNPKFLKNAISNLQRKQKSLRRKIKGSTSRAKARLLVAKCHERLSNTRNDFQHKLSKAMVDDNQAIIVESLKIKNMLKNRTLSRYITDVAWSNLIAKFEYKLKNAGKYLIKVDQYYAKSQMCVEHDQDINSALYIKQQGLMILKAEGLSVSAS